MADSPNFWNINDAIVFEIFVGDPDTGVGVINQTSYMTFTLRRDSDLYYWTGSAWSATRTELTPTETDDTYEPGRYTYTLLAAGNLTTDRYVGYLTVDNAPTVQGNAVEAHISRDTDVKIYESEPSLR